MFEEESWLSFSISDKNKNVPYNLIIIFTLLLILVNIKYKSLTGENPGEAAEKRAEKKLPRGTAFWFAAVYLVN